MTNIFQNLREWVSPVKSLAPGMYHYISPINDPRNYRLHLRIDPDSNGLLILNASTILHLNQTAAEYAYGVVNNLADDIVARRMSSRFTVDREVAKADYRSFIDRLQILINTPDLDPETFLNYDHKPAHNSNLVAPLRLDCALTYRLFKNSPNAAPLDRVKRELSADEWKIVLDKAIAAGIPHIVFTGGEPTLRDDLADLIAHAERNGQVTGLISDGLRFSDPTFLNEILLKGLDHLTIVSDLENPQIWDILQSLVAADIFLVVHHTLTSDNIPDFPEFLTRLVQIGVRAISLSTPNPELKNEIERARNLVAARHIELVWNLPVPYSALNPIAFETATLEQTPGAGQEWLYLEPDGDVLPSQGINTVLGNLLLDPWEKIWQK